MDEAADYGPAMSMLSDRQRRFVLALIENPGLSNAQAARQAGYSDIAEGAKVRGHYCAHNPAVQAALREEAGRRLNAGTLVAAGVVIEILQDENASRKDKLTAAAMLLDRTGFAAAQNINVHKTVTDQSGVAIMARIRALAEKHGLDPQALLGGRPMKVIEHQEKTDA